MGRKRIHLTPEALREAKNAANRRYMARRRAQRPAPPTVEERFWAKVSKGEGCWLWKRALNEHGYGYVRHAERMQLAHRVSWQITHGPIPDRMHVLHRCDNPPCVRPDHLFLGDQRSNMEDAAAKGRHAKSGRTRVRVRSGSFVGVRGVANARARLTWDAVTDIRTRYAAGESQMALGRAFDVTNATIWLVVHDRAWREEWRP